MYPSNYNRFSCIRTASAKNRRYHVPQTTFLFPLETPLRLSRNMLHGWKDNSMLPKSLAVCTYVSIFNCFQVIRCLSQCVSPKIANFTTFLAITLNVVWMERKFDAYKLSGCMCPSKYNRFWNRTRYWSKIVIFSYPLAFDAPVRGVPVGISPPRLVWKN